MAAQHSIVRKTLKIRLNPTAEQGAALDGVMTDLSQPIDIRPLPKTLHADAGKVVNWLAQCRKKEQARRTAVIEATRKRIAAWEGLLKNPAGRFEETFSVPKYAFASDRKRHPKYFALPEIQQRISRLQQSLKGLADRPISLPSPVLPFDTRHLKISSENGVTISGLAESVQYYGRGYVDSQLSQIDSYGNPAMLARHGTDYYLYLPVRKALPAARQKIAGGVGIVIFPKDYLALLCVLAGDGTIREVRFFSQRPLRHRLTHAVAKRKRLASGKERKSLDKMQEKHARFAATFCHTVAREIVSSIASDNERPTVLVGSPAAKPAPLGAIKEAIRREVSNKARWRGLAVAELSPKAEPVARRKCHRCVQLARPQPAQKTFKCSSCNYSCNSDLNAAVNIAKDVFTKRATGAFHA